MKAQLIRDLRYGPSAGPGKQGLTAPSGTVIDDAQAHHLVRHGHAIPADEECRAACGLTEQQILRAIAAGKKAALGIHPDDYQKFEQGKIAGYNPDGSYKPGPNWTDEDEDEPLA